MTPTSQPWLTELRARLLQVAAGYRQGFVAHPIAAHLPTSAAGGPAQ